MNKYTLKNLIIFLFMPSKAIMYILRRALNKPSPFIILGGGGGVDSLLFTVIILLFRRATGFVYPFRGIMFVE